MKSLGRTTCSRQCQRAKHGSGVACRAAENPEAPPFPARFRNVGTAVETHRFKIILPVENRNGNFVVGIARIVGALPAHRLGVKAGIAHTQGYSRFRRRSECAAMLCSTVSTHCHSPGAPEERHLGSISQTRHIPGAPEERNTCNRSGSEDISLLTELRDFL